jgi:hypothetical protein
MLGRAPCSRRKFVIVLCRTPKYGVMLPQIVEMENVFHGIMVPWCCGTPAAGYSSSAASHVEVCSVSEG